MSRFALRWAFASTSLLLFAACTGPDLDLSLEAEPSAPHAGQTVTLTGTLSETDEALAYLWNVVKAPAESASQVVAADTLSATFVPDVKGSYTLSLTVQSADLRTGGGISSNIERPLKVTTEVTFEVSSRPAASIVFQVQPTDIRAGAAFAPVVTVALLDDQGEVAEATDTVNLALNPTATPSTAGLLGPGAMAAQAGLAAFTALSVDKVGTYTLTAEVEGLGAVTSDQFEVTANDAIQVAVEIAPGEVVADGTTPATVTVTVTDAYGNPVPGAEVSLEATGAGHAFGAESGVCDEDGAFVTTLTSTKAEKKTVTATADEQSGEADVTFIAGPADASKTKLEVTPDTVVADGTTPATVTVTVTDAFGNPVAGEAVALEATGSNNAFADATGVTDANGVFSTTLTSTKAETKTVTATVAGETVDANVTFVAGEPGIGTSTFTATPGTVVADNQDFATLTATLKDAQGNPVPDREVEFASDGSANHFSSTTATTDANGVAQVTLTSTKAEEKSLTATFAPGRSLPASVKFVAGAADTSTTKLEVTPDTVVADGTTPATVTVTVTDAFGNPVVGEPVALEATGSNNAFADATGVTDANGVFSTTLTSTKAETKTVTATVAGATVDANVTFVAGAPAIGTSTFSATPGTVVADDEDFATLTATLKDAQGNPVPGREVEFASDGSANHFSSTTATTDANGVAEVTLTSTKAEGKSLTATFAPGRSLPASVKFVAGAPDELRTTFTASPQTVVADDVSTSALSLTVRDFHGNPVVASVTLSASGTGYNIGSGLMTTDAAGEAATTIRSRVDEVKTITASITASDVTISKAAAVKFTEAPPEITLLTAPDPMSSCATITYTIKQMQSKPVTVSMQYALTGASAFVSPTRHTTEGDGLVALTSSPTGVAHTFVWNTTTDIARRTFDTVSFRATPTITASGLAGETQTVTSQTVANALDFKPKAMTTSSDTRRYAVALVDLNMDGHLDIVTGMGEPASDDAHSVIEVHLNDKAGGFENALSTRPSKGSVTQVIAADFNGDGKPDVAFVDGQVGVFLGDGTGFLGDGAGVANQKWSDYCGTSAECLSVQAGDIFRSGRGDLVTGATDGSVRVWRNLGDGSMDLALEFQHLGENLRALVLADFNKDGRLDWAAASQDGRKVYVGFNGGSVAGDWEIREYDVGNAVSIAAADLNADGSVDLAVGNVTADGDASASVLLNDGSGAFHPERRIGLRVMPLETVLVDIDIDGKLDLLVGVEDGKVEFHKGRGDGSFERSRILSSDGFSPMAVALVHGRMAVGDFNNDGRLDIAASDGGNNFEVALNTMPYRCDPGFRLPRSHQSPTHASSPFITQGDFNGDGLLDLATASDGVLGIAFGRPNGTFDDAVIFPAGVVEGGVFFDYPATAITSGDIDDNGIPDIILTSSTSDPSYGSGALVFMNGDFATPLFGDFPSGYSAAHSVSLIDVTGDGTLDLVFPQTNATTLIDYRVDNIARVGGTQSSSFGAPLEVCGFDYNRDGKTDLAISGHTGFVLEGNGAVGGFTPAFTGFDVQSLLSVETGDYNHDGWPDLAFSSDNTGNIGVSVRIFINNQTGGFTKIDHRSPTTGAATGLAQADFDGDGNIDLLIPTTDGKLGVLQTNADGTSKRRSAFPVTTGNTLGRMVTSDYNRDGIPDVAIVDTTGKVHVLLGR